MVLFHFLFMGVIAFGMKKPGLLRPGILIDYGAGQLAPVQAPNAPLCRS